MSTQTFLRRREVIQRTGLSQSRLYEEIAEGRFPKPVPIGARAVAWVGAEVAEWQMQRIAERDSVAANNRLPPAA